MSWKDVSLGNLFSVGSSKRVLKSQWKTKGVPFYRGREVTKLAEHGSVDNELFISEEHFSELAEKYGVPEPGDIVITAIGTIGNSYIVRPGDRFYFKDASVLWLSKKSDVDSAFINYWLQSPWFKRQLEKGNGATVDTLTIGKLRSARIALPSLPEQKRIVAILDEALAGVDAAIANTEKNVTNARELFESYLYSVFSKRGKGWVEKPLTSFVDSVSTGPFGSLLHKSDYVSEGVPLVNPVNIVGEEIVPDKKKMIDANTRERLGSYILKAGDVVIARRGEIGRCAVVTKHQEGWVCGTGCFFIRPTTGTNSFFLSHLLKSSSYRAELKRLSTGATMLNLSNKALSSLRVAMPSLAEQDIVVDLISELRSQCKGVRSAYQQKLLILTELKQSLLQKAFSSELITAKVVRDETLKEEVA